MIIFIKIWHIERWLKLELLLTAIFSLLYFVNKYIMTHSKNIFYHTAKFASYVVVLLSKAEVWSAYEFPTRNIWRRDSL